MKIDSDAALIKKTSQEQLRSDIEKKAKDGLINREGLASVLNKDLGMPLASTHTIFSFVEKNQRMISTISKDEFTDAMKKEFDLLKENPPKKADGWIADIFGAAGWDNDPCTGKQIAYTLDVLIDTAEMTAGAESGYALIDGARSIGEDLYHAYEAYTDCN